MPLDSLKAEDFAFYVLVGIAATPQGVFRGTRKDLLRYMGVAASSKNEKLISPTLLLWKKLNIIDFKPDGDKIVIFIKRDFEKAEIIPIQMLKECQRIIKEQHKQTIKIAQLIKVWQAHRICEKNQPFTIEDIKKYVNLSNYQIKDARKMLVNSDIFNLNAAMAPGISNCRIGTNVELNGIYDRSKV